MTTPTSYSVKSTAYSKSIIVSTTPVILLGITVYNSGAAQFIQLHDGAAVPANGVAPSACPLPIGAAGLLALWYGSEGRYFPNGLVICNSSTAPTKTIGADDCWFDIQIRVPQEK